MTGGISILFGFLPSVCLIVLLWARFSVVYKLFFILFFGGIKNGKKVLLPFYRR